jgi:hypothetical protein
MLYKEDAIIKETATLIGEVVDGPVLEKRAASPLFETIAKNIARTAGHETQFGKYMLSNAGTQLVKRVGTGMAVGAVGGAATSKEGERGSGAIRGALLGGVGAGAWHGLQSGGFKTFGEAAPLTKAQFMERGAQPFGEQATRIVRNYDIVLLDGKYYFANHAKTIEYRESVKDEIDAWMDIMSAMEPELLERTTLYTHPKITEGLVRVLLDNGVERFIDSTQALNITYTVDERIATNVAAIDEIKLTTITTLQAILSNNPTVSDSDLVKGLKDKLGDWILGVKLEGFLGNEFETVSVLDSSISLSIPKRLAITTNLELTVENDININFVTHSTLTT